mmetsp:Transcript_34866/g.86535  ORF Transcript_34866/g.86535 Transcript_34866/m.86535 type:complete len:165 (+) Transcript_34866:51-545(+)
MRCAASIFVVLVLSVLACGPGCCMSAVLRGAGKKMREVIKTANAPAAMGPYSQAIKANGMLFLAGQLGVKPDTADYESTTDVKVQAKQAFENMKAVLEAGGSDLEHVVKTTVLLTDMKDFVALNEVYSSFFPPDKAPPARTCYATKELPKKALVEVEAIAVLKE